MKRTITEQRVLKKLGISDFRHMTKDKIVKFASMLPYMDPEVAKKALEQFPTFKDLASNLVTEYKGIVEKALESNEISQNVFYQSCQLILESLQKELTQEDISPAEKQYIEERMIEVARMIGEKDSENKNFLWKMASTVGAVTLSIGAIAAAIIGSNMQFSQGNLDSGMDDNEDVIDI